MTLAVLSEAETVKLHKRTLEIFDSVGVRVTHDEALKRLRKAGARVDEASSQVRFQPDLVQELLDAAPPVAVATGLNGKILEIGGDNRYYGSLILDPVVVPYGGGPRPPVLEDVRRHTIIGESLDRVNAMMRMQYPVSDVPEPDCYLKTMEVFLSHTTKHIAAMPASVENCREWMDVMACIAEAAGLDVKTPLMSLATAVTSPLQIHGPNIEIMKMAIERHYPLKSTVCPMAGTTSPYSIAGTALIANVESLAAVLVAQVYSPGHPVFYGYGPSVTDMRTGHDLYYKAEKMIFKTIAAQMGKYYGLPVTGEAGGSLTFRPDVQNGAESMAYLLASLLGGQNMMSGLGSLHNANGMSAEQIVMQCGLVDMAEYLGKGVDLSDRKLAVKSVKDAGPGGDFLTDDLTLELLRSDEFFQTPYMDLTGGNEGDAPGMVERAHATAEQLVESYQSTVPEKVRKAIRDFFRDKYESAAVAEM